MGRLVTIAAGERGISLPNNQTYNSGESVILTDDEWEQVSPHAIGTTIIDGGPVGSAAPGADGKSAYDLAVEHGFSGTVQDWLASLQGAPGDPGSPGDPGAPGADATSVQILVSNHALGTQTAAQAAFTYYAITGVAQRGLVTRFVLTPSDVGSYEAVVVGTSNGSGEQFLHVVGATGVYDISAPFHFENSTNDTLYVGVKNTGSVGQTFTLTTLRVERFA